MPISKLPGLVALGAMMNEHADHPLLGKDPLSP
jgi:hypothetical protein